jgi:hypothetical protein
MHAVIDDALAQTRGSPRSGVMAARPARPLEASVSAPAQAPSGLDDFASIPSLLVGTPSGRASSPDPRIGSASAIHMAGPAPTTVERPSGPIRRWPVAAGVGAAVGCATLLLLHDIATPSRGEPPQLRAPAVAMVGQPVVVVPVAPEATASAAPVAAEPRVNVVAPSVVVVPRAAPAQRPAPQVARPARVAPGMDAVRSASPSPEAPLESTRVTVDPAGGRMPQRPIVTSNPYGSP